MFRLYMIDIVSATLTIYDIVLARGCLSITKNDMCPVEIPTAFLGLSLLFVCLLMNACLRWCEELRVYLSNCIDLRFVFVSLLCLCSIILCCSCV